ncbi:ATP-binding protein [Sulfuriflexus sp.]|uniref:ATP-binding protein n=1 Tax=Sulfuriflexus sp. TaxID=2015443 RepID=UPI0028CCB65D|nr:ATP-binding protein [Sulfuriflexus sp.]MDT8403985.1 histidine kinase [Sulfuriflexus sp.]
MNPESILQRDKINQTSHYVPDDSLGALSGNIVVSTLSRNRLLVPILGLLVTLLLFAATTFIGFFWPNHADVVFITQLLLLVCGLFLLAYTVYRIRQQMLKPIADLRNWSQRIRAGDLHKHIDLPPRGEFASLIQDVNGLTDELHSLTEEMDQRVREQTAHIANKSRSLEILYDITTSLSSTGNLDELLEQFLDTLMTLVDASAASVRLVEGLQTRLVASRGMTSTIREEDLLVDMNRCMCGRISQHGGLGIQKGVEACNQFLSCAVVEGNCSEMVVVPLQYQDRILGVYNLFLERPSSELGRDARDLLNSIGKHLGLAIAKSRLDVNARRLAIMEERNMIGNELHDSLAQALVGMRLQTKMLGETLYKKDVRAAQSEVRRLNTSIDEAHTSLRELLSNFRSRMDERGLVYAVQDLIYNFKQETGINTYFHTGDIKDHAGMSPAQEFQAYRIIQEALANIKKHSNACNVRILFNRPADGGCTILIEDDGLGISDDQEIANPGEHIGLSVMQERADALGGELEIESDAGEGTRIILHIPQTNQKHLETFRNI